MDPLNRLVAIEEIKQLKARHARVVDTKRWESLADVFTEDAVMRHPHLGTLRGADATGASPAFVRTDNPDIDSCPLP
jgi:hypothetical protein